MSSTTVRPHRSKTLPLVVAALVVGLIAGWLVPVASLGMLRGESGDADLARRARAALGDPRGYDSADVAEVIDGRVATATLGPRRGRFEPGSITKVFTGHLFADAVARGEVAYADPLDKHLPELAGTSAGRLTLESLATHRSGLPREAPSRLWGAIRQGFALDDPFDDYGRAHLVNEAKTMPLMKPGEYAYSNVGAALLGHALAAAAREPDWPTLARTRLFEPLGMTSTTVAGRDADVPTSAVQGKASNGLNAEPWTSLGEAPAGSSTWTTAEDLGRFAQAVLEGRAPGMAATDPRAPAGSRQIGLFWMNQDTDGRQLVWHNGSTGGSYAMLVIDPEAKRAVVVMGNTRRPVEKAALALVTDRPTTERPEIGWVAVALLALSAIMVGLQVSRLLRPRSRTRWVEPSLGAAATLVVTWRLGPWDLVPSAVLSALVAVWLMGVGLGVAQSGRLPWTTGKPVRAWAAVALSTLGLAVVAALVLGG